MTTKIETNKHDDDPSLSETENDQSFTSSADSESSNSCPFSTEICEKLTAAFAKATGIDLQLAAQLLNQHGWNIDDALAASYEAKEKVQEMIKNVDWKIEKDKFFRVLSWNVNLSDSDDEEINALIEQRAEKIIEVLLREKPDVILLQRIGTLALTLLITCLSSLYDDESIQIDPSKNSDYVSILTKKSIVKKANVSIFEYEDHWRMLKMKILYRNSIPLDLFNTFFDTTTLTDQINSFCLQQIDDPANNHRSIVALSNVSQTNFRLTNLKSVGDFTGEQPTSDRLLYRCSLGDESEFNPIHCESFSIASDETLPTAQPAMLGYFIVS